MERASPDQFHAVPLQLDTEADHQPLQRNFFL
jgi:hypothetical protein